MEAFKFEYIVEEYGTKSQIESFKRMGNLPTNQYNSLLRTVEQWHEHIQIDGRGSKRIFTLSEKLKAPRKREDGRENNSGYRHPLPYDNALNSIVIKYLIENCYYDMGQYSINKWLEELSLISKSFRISNYDNQSRREELDKLIEKYGSVFEESDIRLINDFFINEVGRLQGNLKSIFNQLSKNKLINQRITMFGEYEDGRHIELSKDMEVEITNMKRVLRDKHEITMGQLIFSNSASVKAYKNEEREKLSEYGLVYTYTSYGIHVKVEKERLENFLNKLIKDEKLVFTKILDEEMFTDFLNKFINSYGEHSSDKAKDRQKSNKNSDLHLQKLKMRRTYVPKYEAVTSHYGLSDKEDIEFENGADVFEGGEI